jgi:excisionase family DNA binding protein
MSQNNYSLSASTSLSGAGAQENLLTPAEVATLFRVDPKTVTRWAKAGKLTSIRTLGGHRRYKESEVKELLKTTTPNQSGGN